MCLMAFWDEICSVLREKNVSLRLIIIRIADINKSTLQSFTDFLATFKDDRVLLKANVAPCTAMQGTPPQQYAS